MLYSCDDPSETKQHVHKGLHERVDQRKEEEERILKPKKEPGKHSVECVRNYCVLIKDALSSDTPNLLLWGVDFTQKDD